MKDHVRSAVALTTMHCKPFRLASRLGIFNLLLVALALLAPLPPACGATLEWGANPETDLAGYKVYIGSQSRQYDTILEVGLRTQELLPPLQPGYTYYFAISAYNNDNLESELSEELAYTAGQFTTATPLTNLTVCPGEPASFATTVGGIGPFGFVWKKNGVVIDGATSAGFTIPAVLATHAGAYTIEISSASNTLTNTASLTVNEPVTATPLTDVAVYAGGVASFATTAVGPGPFGFVWKKDGVMINGATSALLTIAGVSALHAGTYTVEVSGGCATVTNAALLTVWLNDTNTLPVALQITFSDPTSPVAISFLGEAGRLYVLQASTDMQSWQTVHTVTLLTAGINQWLDTAAPSQPMRFYRVLGSAL